MDGMRARYTGFIHVVFIRMSLVKSFNVYLNIHAR